MKSLAIITARGGSKRIPRKNIKEFCGRPIIIYSIEAALKSGAFDEVMVSTDDKEIARIAADAGASVPFFRSEDTSNDHAGTDAVIAEVLSCYRESDITFDRFCCIYPTAPFITPARLKEAMDMLNAHESVCPVCQFSYPPQRGFIIENDVLVRAHPEYAFTRSQDLKKLYHDAGQFYACRTDAFLRENCTDTDDMIPLIFNDDEVQDIDTFEDWRIAERKYLSLRDRSLNKDTVIFDDHALKTPYYRVDESALDKDIKLLKDSLDTAWSNNIRSYSVKTNALPWLLCKLRDNGFYAEVVSAEEYELAMKLGFDAAKVIYNGPIKDRDVFEKVLRDGGIVNIDSSDEEKWLKELSDKLPSVNIGIRVNYDLSSLVPDEVLADDEGSRFGYCYENGELKRVISALKDLKNVNIAGLHLHSSTRSRSVNAYRALAKTAVLIADEFKLNLSYVDMGGGYYGGLKDKPDYSDYMPAIAGELKKGFDPAKTALIVEPGVSLISSAFDFVSSVLDVKSIRDNNYIVTDGSRLYLNPQITRRWYPHRLEYSDDGRAVINTQTICGHSCMEYDRLFTIENEKELRPGDRVVYTNAGGYTLCLSPLFIRYFPAVYIKKNDGSLFTARRPWTNEDYLQGYGVE
ncbi:MAG: pseudaminic acid cytidylyltransferase [Lachnospiraceae bacterium]|nr:pseudaminic acid cytidylyltransferase [Lachnospiraceae bacterium]